MSMWSQFAWKQVNYLVGTQWPAPARPWDPALQGVLKTVVLKGKSYFFRRRKLRCCNVLYFPCPAKSWWLLLSQSCTRTHCLEYAVHPGSMFWSPFHYVLLCLDFYQLSFSSQHFLPFFYIQMVLYLCSPKPVMQIKDLTRESKVF